MNELAHDTQGKILAFVAIVEVATGLALLAAPGIVVALLLGPNEPLEVRPVARFLGIALLALGLACWPNRQRSEARPTAFRGMWTYNLLVVLLLGYVGAIEHRAGLLLWPAVALHTVVALALAWTWYVARQNRAGG